MSKSATRNAILMALRQRPLTADAIVKAVYPGLDVFAFAMQVELRAEVTQTIGELKLEHRIWPEKGKYRITSKGRVSHG